MGVIARKFAESYCDSREERRRKSDALRDELYGIMAERARERREERDRQRMLPPAVRRELSVARIFLGVFSAVFAAATVLSVRLALVGAAAVSAVCAALFAACGWRKMAAVPALCAASGLVIGLIIKTVWGI